MFISFSDALFSSLLLCSDVLTFSQPAVPLSLCGVCEETNIPMFLLLWLVASSSSNNNNNRKSSFIVVISIALQLFYPSYCHTFDTVIHTQGTPLAHSCYQPTKHLHSRSLSSWSHRLLQSLVFCCFMLCCHMNKSCQIISVMALYLKIYSQDFLI